MRAKSPNTADGHWKLGVWCEQKGLKAQAEMEFMVVCQLDPKREAAWKKLGYLKQNGKVDDARQDRRRACRSRGPEEGRCTLATAHPELESRPGRRRTNVLSPSVRSRRSTTRGRCRRSGRRLRRRPEDQEMAVDMLGHIEGERPSRAWQGWRCWARPT